MTSLAAITTADLAGFAGRNQMPVEMVRHAYYKALANALAAEIELNPAQDEERRNLQQVFLVFLNMRGGADDGDRSHNSASRCGR